SPSLNRVHLCVLSSRSSRRPPTPNHFPYTTLFRSPLETPAYSDMLIEDEDMARTIYSMGTSMLTWTQKVSQLKLFADDARVLGLTSEGNTIAWRGYAAVSAAKV